MCKLLKSVSNESPKFATSLTLTPKFEMRQTEDTDPDVNKTGETHQILYVHYAVDGISLKTNWKLKFLRFSKLVRQSERISMIDVFLWKLKKHPRRAEILLDEMSQVFVGNSYHEGKTCIHDLVESLVKTIKKKWGFLPKQKLLLAKAMDDAKTEFDKLNEVLQTCTETCKNCTQLVYYLYGKGKNFARTGRWSNGNGFVVDKFSFFQVQIDRNEKENFERARHGYENGFF